MKESLSAREECSLKSLHGFRITQAQEGQRLDQFLAGSMPGYSRERIKSWIEEGRVRIDGLPARRASIRLRVEQSVEVEPAERKPLRAFPEDLPLSILYEDDGVVAIDKPAGLVVHAGAGQTSGTLVNALLHRFSGLSRTGDPLRPGIVHRLDKGTSGVLLVAKTDAAHQHLAAQFAARTVEKIYLALVQGQVAKDSGEIRTPIDRDPVSRIRMTTRTGKGRASFTAWRVIERLPRHTLLEVKIGTGRTHQIRVHLASIHHPVAGDTLYGAARNPEPDRPWLHAWKITFSPLPGGGTVTVVSPVPEELEAWKKRLLQ